MEPKPWWHSKTVWLGILTAVSAVLADPNLFAVLPKEWAPKIALIAGVVGICLRLATSQPVGK